MNSREALDRTLLISGALLGHGPLTHEEVLHQLTSTRVALIADERNLATISGQSAMVTLAGLLLAQGVSLVLVMPDVQIVGHQPPLEGQALRAGLIHLAADSIPGCAAEVAQDWPEADLIFVLGDSPAPYASGLAWRLIGGEWWGGTVPAADPAPTWTCALPVGAGVAAAVASIEVYKHALRRVVLNLGLVPAIPELLEPTRKASFSFGGGAPAWTGLDLGKVDFISGGAINTAALHVLHRIPNLTMRGRVVEPDTLDISNLNRYPLARRRDMGRLKAEALTQWNTDHVDIIGVVTRYSEETQATLAPLAPRVIVGTDDVKARWLVQRQWPTWLGVGATADFLTLTSEHRPGDPCAGCVHPVDDDVNVPIPTLSTVSYWAGLLLAGRLLRAAYGLRYPSTQQAVNLWPLRMDLATSVLWQPVPRHPRCPVESSAA